VKTALLDLNILTALLWPAHEHHEAAHRWFSARTAGRWATCSLTQLSLVRLLSNPAFSRDALTPVEAAALLAENIAHPAHEFWAERIQIPAAIKPLETALQGYRQLTDAYLLALAGRRNGVLATFDGGLRTLAGKKMASAVEIVPTGWN
jgi:toxin-antitoxin system PIN domain toxin